MSKHDGGPAFPRPCSEVDGSLGQMWNDSQLGMSLRDWFAGKALSVIEVRKGCVAPDQVASLAYAIADALLVERHKSTVDNL